MKLNHEAMTLRNIYINNGNISNTKPGNINNISNRAKIVDSVAESCIMSNREYCMRVALAIAISACFQRKMLA